MSEKCVISDVEFKESSIHPVILNFGNGVLQPGHEDSLACRIYKDKKRNTLVAAATEKMVYSGAVKPDDLFNTFIGIRNTKTNKMRLVAVQYALLSPHLTNEECPLNISLKESEVTTADLKKQFGSKRAIRHTEQQERMKMDIENVREQLEKTAAESMDPQQADSDDDGDLLNISTDSNPPSGKPDKMLGTSNFLALLGTINESYYIDKTNLIDAFLNCGRSRVLVTAPRRFGKTINLAMLETFFVLQVSAGESKMLSEDELQIKIEETGNYKLFQEHQLAITKKSDLMKKHFGRYPVLQISFKCDGSVSGFKDAIRFYSKILSDTFAEHEYLLNSEALLDSEKTICKKWLDREWNVEKDKVEICLGLKTLAKYLYKHFGKEIVLLVDEYDSVIAQAILTLKAKDELKHLIRFCVGVIQAAVKENVGQNWIKYAFITGISHIAGMGLSGSNIKPFRFLENHDFVPYYGLRPGDVTQLLQKTYGFDEDRIEEVRKKFNGYSTVRGVKIYNTWSVLEYASKTNEDDSTYEWQDTGYIVGLEEAFRFPEIMKIIQTKLLLDHPIEIKKLKCFTLKDVLNLVNIIGEVDPQNVDYPRPDLFFSFILEQGYLSFVKKKPGQVVIPNDQIKKQIEDKLTDFTIGVFDGDTTYIEKCKEFLLKISKMNCDHDDFKNFHVNLEVVLQKYAARWIKKNEANIRCTIKILVDNLGFKDCAELLFNFEGLGVEVKRILDFIVIKDDFVMIWEIKYKESNKKAVLCIKDREYLKVLKNKNIIRSTVTRWVLMGINMDENGQVSIGYLQNSENFDDMTLIP